MSITLSYTASRNPLITLIEDDEIYFKISCIGDPHLGRTFKTGVPSHRIGVREQTVLNQFRCLLNPTDKYIKYVVIMGDLFDKYVVNPTVVLTAFNLIKEAYLNNPSVNYVLLPGNHDLSKDSSKTSSYELLIKMLEKYQSQRLHLVLHNSSYIYVDKPSGNSGVVLSFDAYKPFLEEREKYQDKRRSSWEDAKHIISFGHWDSLEILESGYVPDQELLDASTLVVSGHEHTYKEYVYPFDKNGSKVLFTGSLQPYSHAEDPDQCIYTTIDQDDLEKYDLNSLKFKVVRILCDHNFVLSKPIDCFALSYKYKEVAQEVEDEDLQYTDDSYNSLMEVYIKSLSSDTNYEKEILEMFKEKGFINVST